MAMQRYNPGRMAGLEDEIAAKVSDALFGKPGTGSEAQRQEFFSGVLSKTAVKFVKTPEGQQTINKVTYTIAIPMFALGLLVGYLYFKKR